MTAAGTGATPRSRRVPALVATLLVALVAGAAGAVTGGWLSWRSAPPLPGSDAPLFDYDPPITSTADRVLVPILGGDGYTASRVESTTPADNPPAALRAEHARLSAAGWHTHAIVVDRYGQSFWASRGAFSTTVSIENRVGENGVLPESHEPDLTTTLRRAAPDATRWGVPLGWVIGAFAGVLIRPHGLLSLIGLAMIFPAATLTALVAVSYAAGPTNEPAAPWLAFMTIGLRPLAFAGIVVLLAAVALAARGTFGRMRKS
jgi:hypothetical protein